MTLIWFLLILSALVFVHELGHFLMAKRAGILVEEFGFGLPPRVWSKKIGETVYSVNALPIGGFVKLYGEEGKDSGGQEKGAGLAGRAFFEKSIFQRATVILAGVLMNFFLAIAVFSLVYSLVGIPTETGQIKIIGLAKDSPAEIAGLKVGDQVIGLDGTFLISTEEFIKLTQKKAGGVIILEIERDKDNPCSQDQQILSGDLTPGHQFSCSGNHLLFTLIPRKEPPEGEGALGVAITDMEMKRYPFWLMPFYGVREGLQESFAWSKTIVASLVQMVSGLSKGQVPKDVAGPIGIYQATGMVAQSGVLALLEFLGVLSINLAIINILPFPALDGGRFLFLGIEIFSGKKVSPSAEAWVNNFGMMVLLLLVLLVTINDIIRVLSTSQILEKINLIF